MPKSPLHLQSFSHRHALQLAAIVAALMCIGVSSVQLATATPPPSRLLVKFLPAASAASKSGALAGINGDAVGSVRDLGIDVVSVDASNRGPALAALNHNPNVEFAEPDAVLEPQESLPNDPYFPQQSALNGGAWGWYQTHTTQAWDITKGDPSVVVAILDTGLKTAGLSDFGGQVVSGWNVLSGTSDTSSNAGNHGTYVAGVVGLSAGNGTGGAGFCPGCKIMPVEVGTDSGAYLSDLANGLTWATDHGARVANMSWAGATTSSTLQSAISYAHSKGLVITAAAGNSNCNCSTYPAAYSGVLAVGGTDNSGNKAGDSNYGNWVTLVAPEGNITAWPTINGAPGYAPVGGTSIAAPVVAGIAGLLFSYKPGLTNTQVEQALEQTAAPVPFTVAYGRVDALAALQYLGASDPQPSSAPVQTDPPRIYYELGSSLSSIAPLSGAPQPGQVLVRGVGGWTGSAGLAVTGLQWQRCDALGLACSGVTAATTYTVQTSDVGSTIKLVFSVRNPIGSTPASVLTLPVGGTGTPPPPSPAPANTAPPAITGVAQDGQTLTASAGSWSGSPTGYGYQWSRCDTSGGACSNVSGATGTTYSATTADVGATVRVTVTATNPSGSASATSAVTAVVASAPAPPPTPTTQTLTFSGSLNSRNPVRSFTVNTGSGSSDARLVFSKCNSLALSLSNGAAAQGPSAVVLDSTLVNAGSYTYQVSGGRCSFTLTVTAPTP
jgi:thermitase